MLLLPIILWWAKSPMRFSVGRSRQLICFVSLWAVTAAAFPMASQVIASEPVQSSNGAGGNLNAHVIREGTIVPPTSGRVVMLGRRWAFVPDESTLLHRQLKGELLSGKLDEKARSNPNLRRLVDVDRATDQVSNKRGVAVKFDRINRMIGPVTMVNLPTRLASSRADRDASTDTKKDSSVEGQVILAENLMLQRIVSSLRNDVSDDRWVVSGTISEFFGENRMVISAAQRGNAE